MKAKLKSTRRIGNTTIQEGTDVKIIKGMEADAADVLNTPEGICYLCEHEGNMFYIPAKQLTITDWSNIDWEQRRYELVKTIVHGELTTPNSRLNSDDKEIARLMVSFADVLIEELKKKAE